MSSEPPHLRTGARESCLHLVCDEDSPGLANGCDCWCEKSSGRGKYAVARKYGIYEQCCWTDAVASKIFNGAPYGSREFFRYVRGVLPIAVWWFDRPDIGTKRHVGAQRRRNGSHR